MASRSVLSLNSRRTPGTHDEIARAYDSAGVHYLTYADGPGRDLFDFGGRYSYGDRRIWTAIEARLVALAEAGCETLRVLDIGCGPGTWLRRVVVRAWALGIPHIEARGFDISGEQIAIARMRANDLRDHAGVRLRFETADMTHKLPEATGSVDLCLCLNGVLNHVEMERQASVCAELARVTRGALLVSVRTVGSQPSIFVDHVERATAFRQDHHTNRLVIDLSDGRHIEFSSHCFAARELEALLAPHIGITRLCGLDLFHSRFAPDPRWNPEEGAESDDFHADLERLELSYSSDPRYIDHATHLLMLAEPYGVAER
ncbi:class I SAM-dependent methyltransferase [Sphingomonas sp. LaA6.9]|uniref:class I SAM-dependent methyltransferase n=1 Tax=Sphingomonas sp. LaA6.9 TaxID=2919914 RepID=UPI001F4F1A03|nr:class I SAM-dependent methyltransferase [Sphingomonas sp. LaA6.9]MCJ8159345.1 class I SAM-dependent methyltransferase [Sphingomonas sp. LaA6.9]